MRMPQTIVPASIAADKTKLYLDHQSKLILRTRYSAIRRKDVKSYRRQGGEPEDEKLTKDKADDE